MQVFKKLLGTTYQYTDSLDDVPDFVSSHLKNNYGIDLNKEKLVCSTWSYQLGSKGTFYVVVTENRVISRKGNQYNQIFLKNVTSIERSATGDTVLKAPGVKIDLFHMMAMPKKTLLDIIFGKINIHWSSLTEQAS